MPLAKPAEIKARSRAPGFLRQSKFLEVKAVIQLGEQESCAQAFGAENGILLAYRNIATGFIDVELEQTVVAHVPINKATRWNYAVFVLVLKNSAVEIGVLAFQPFARGAIDWQIGIGWHSA